jgi:hypothetical protein
MRLIFLRLLLIKKNLEEGVGIKQWFVGPFINYAIIDTQYNRILVLEVLLYP